MDFISINQMIIHENIDKNGFKITDTQNIDSKIVRNIFSILVTTFILLLK